jgi:hypothetical protein
MKGRMFALGLLLLTAPIASAKDLEKVPSPPSTALPVLESTSQVYVPLDELLAGSPGRAFAFLSTLGSDGKPTSLLLLDGDTLFVPEISTALRKESFDLRYANRQVIIQGSIPGDPAPLPKNPRRVIVLENVNQPTQADKQRIEAEKQRESEAEPCTASMDKDTLVREGARNQNRNSKSAAYRCFQIALSKAPVSIAALEGASWTCDEKSDTGCRVRYLAQIVAQRPDYYGARINLADAYRTPQDQSRTILELREILAENPPPPVQLNILGSLAFTARGAGDTLEEVLYRGQWSDVARRYFALYPQKFDAFYSRIGIVFNDEPLALDLEGLHRWTEAEEIYRRNLSMIAVDPLFQKEVKFDEQLGLSRTLAAQGKNKDAARICSQWKWPARLIAGRGTAFWGYASRPVEIAKWDLSCGKEQEGLALLQKESAAHPWIYATYVALRDYYYSQGDVHNALKADEQNSKAHELADSRVGW